MALVVVTRLRVRDQKFFDDFFAAAVAVVEQATASEGNIAADVLAEAHNTYWTRSCWQHAEAMRRFMTAEPHLGTMNRIDHWCDVATFVNWEQTEAALPDWDDAYDRLIDLGQVVHLKFEAQDNATRSFPPISQPDKRPRRI
jgi:hypothetical protein